MKLLETKEQLTLNDLLRIAYEYGNDTSFKEEKYLIIDEDEYNFLVN